NCLRRKRMKSTVESRSFNAKAQRTPATPISFLVADVTWLLRARLSAGMLSRQRPCSARARAFSGVRVELGDLACCAIASEEDQKIATIMIAFPWSERI